MPIYFNLRTVCANLFRIKNISIIHNFQSLTLMSAPQHARSLLTLTGLECSTKLTKEKKKK